MIISIVTLAGLIIAVGIATGFIEGHLSDDYKEFCEIECRRHKRIYK